MTDLLFPIHDCGTDGGSGLFDLLVLHRGDHVPSIREAVIASAGWIAMGLAFTLVVWWALSGGGLSEAELSEIFAKSYRLSIG